MSNLGFLENLPAAMQPQYMAEQMAEKWNSFFKNREKDKRIDALGLTDVAETLFGLMTEGTCREKRIRNPDGTPVVEFRVSAQKGDGASQILKALGFSGTQVYHDPDDQFVAYTFEGQEQVARLFTLASLTLSKENKSFQHYFSFYPPLQSEEEKIKAAFDFLKGIDTTLVSRDLLTKLEKDQSLESLANLAFSDQPLELVPSVNGDKCAVLSFSSLYKRCDAQTILSRLGLCNPPNLNNCVIGGLPRNPFDISGEDRIAKLLALATHATDQEAIKNASPLLKIAGLSVDRQQESRAFKSTFAQILKKGLGS